MDKKSAGEGHQSSEDADNQNQRKIVLDEWDVAEEIARKNDAADPHNGSASAVKLKAQRVHLGRTGNQRSKRTNDRYETSEHNRFAAVLFVEVVRFSQGVLVNPADGAVVNLIAEPIADIEVRRVSEDRTERNDDDEEPGIQSTCRGCRAGNEKERITRKEGTNDDAGFAVEDHEEHKIDPPAVGLCNVHDEVIRIAEQFQSKCQKVHFLFVKSMDRNCSGIVFQVFAFIFLVFKV